MENFLASWRPQLLSVLRIVIGLLITAHGTAKFLGFPVHAFNNTPATSPIGYAGMFELVLGPLVLIGLFTRPAAFILSGLCAVAYWGWHAPKSFYPLVNGGEHTVAFCFILLYLAAAGAGPLSLDAMVRGKK